MSDTSSMTNVTEDRRTNVDGRRNDDERRKGRSALFSGPERRAVDRRKGVGRRAS